MGDVLQALRLQVEWGADEALGLEPRDRRRSAQPATPPAEAAPPQQRPATFASLEQVDAALLATGGAGLATTARYFVGVRGAAVARVLVVGDCPGEAEERSGVAFSGEAGRLLATMLGSAGIGVGDCAFGYLVPWRPPGGRPPSEAEVGVCAPFLLARIGCRPPRVVVPCAALAARALLGSGAGARSRGRLLAAEVPGVGALPCLVLQPPEQAMATARGKLQAWVTLRLLRRTLDGTEPK